jgi:hypothetical protein
VKQGDLSEYEENAREKTKRYKYTKQITSSPSNQAIGMANTKPHPPQEAKREESRGLVKMSANCLSVSINFIYISPFSTWSLRKWCLTFMCLALPWKIGLWARHMELELSDMRGTLL